MREISRTELVWVGKYNEQGHLRPVEHTILPLQVVETVNESKADREKVQRDLFTLMPRDEAWRNMLIWGDNKVVMSSLLPRFAGKINLIYIDPPFATGQDFSFRFIPPWTGGKEGGNTYHAAQRLYHRQPGIPAGRGAREDQEVQRLY